MNENGEQRHVGTNLKPPPSTKLSFWHILNSVFQFFSFDHSINLDYPNVIDHHGSYKWTSSFHWKAFILRAVLQYLKIPTSRGIILSSCGKPEIKPIRSMRTRVDNPRSTGKLIQSTIPWDVKWRPLNFISFRKKGCFHGISIGVPDLWTLFQFGWKIHKDTAMI